jgi:hypothetical protein
MAAQKLTGATLAPIAPAMSANDVDAHRAASHVRTVDRDAVRARICRDTIAQLSAMDARAMTPADFDRLTQAKAELAEITAQLAPVDSDPDIDEALRRVRGGQARRTAPAFTKAAA